MLYQSWQLELWDQGVGSAGSFSKFKEEFVACLSLSFRGLGQTQAFLGLQPHHSVSASASCGSIVCVSVSLCPHVMFLEGHLSLDLVIVIVQLLNHFLIFAAPWTAARQASLPSSISGGLFRLMSVKLVMDLESTLGQDDLILIWLHLQRLFSAVTFTGTWVRISTYLLFFWSVLNCVLYRVLLGDKLMVPLIWNE